MRFFRAKNKWLYFLVIFVFLPVIVLASIAFFSNKPPVEKLDNCRKIIGLARSKEADKYSPKELNKAIKLWEQAMTEWKLQNSKTITFRNFKKVSDLADEAYNFADKSVKASTKRKKELKNSISEDLITLNKIASQIEVLCKKLPLNHGIRESLTPANLQLNEADAAFKRNDLLIAEKKIEGVKTKILQLKDKTTETLKNYFEDYNSWVKLNNEMIAWSKSNNSVSLVVDKFSRTCLVYKSGKKIYEFEVELGVNWLGGKRFKGDMATPEGKYMITKKKNSKDTKYYKALLIDFPNENDKEKFDRAKKQGKIPKNAHIGGLIEIHGGGGRGIDWTEGCVALENSDMDKLFILCPAGTPIAIVGSLKSIDDLFEL